MSESVAAPHHSHDPIPSKWPIITAFGAGLLPVGIVMNGHGNKNGLAILMLCLLVTIIAAGRWWGELLSDKFAGKDLDDADSRLKTMFKLFIGSEAAIFGA